jgi:hypothetical protein
VRWVGSAAAVRCEEEETVSDRDVSDAMANQREECADELEEVLTNTHPDDLFEALGELRARWRGQPEP